MVWGSSSVEGPDPRAATPWLHKKVLRTPIVAHHASTAPGTNQANNSTEANLLLLRQASGRM